MTTKTATKKVAAKRKSAPASKKSKPSAKKYQAKARQRNSQQQAILDIIDLTELPPFTQEDNAANQVTTKASPFNLSKIKHRLSFYMGAFLGAVVLHALFISIVAVLSV